MTNSSTKKTAQDIAVIANNISDALVIAFPNATWDDYIDKFVEKLIDELGLKPETAKRIAVSTAWNNKKCT